SIMFFHGSQNTINYFMENFRRKWIEKIKTVILRLNHIFFGKTREKFDSILLFRDKTFIVFQIDQRLFNHAFIHFYPDDGSRVETVDVKRKAPFPGPEVDNTVIRSKRIVFRQRLKHAVWCRL